MVNQVVPGGTVSTVTAPVVEAVDGTAATVVESVVPPATAALPVLEPILEPVSDVVTGSAPLPVQLPEIPAEPGPETLPVVDVVAPAASTADGPDAEPTTADKASVAAETGAADDTAASVIASAAGPVAPAVDLASTSFAASQASAAEDAAAETTNPSEPAPAPAAPGSASGGSSQSSGAAGSAAWLSCENFEHFLQGVLLPWSFSAHVPSPVSFDPGSSPD
ncbi:hypothetical protein [Pseudarthrobacter enclensis]|uniref:hypothetical protein n=1 Tax=Pseudarthrobacter enclensis TaxID=993070 RepID=UPI001E2E50B7|nr:hypothetical protein [Pseudarthrobacter enclensis]